MKKYRIVYSGTDNTFGYFHVQKRFCIFFWKNVSKDKLKGVEAITMMINLLMIDKEYYQ